VEDDGAVKPIGRRKPYSARGISRVPCVRCGASAAYQWAACSLDNRWAPVCVRCDVLLNSIVLRFFRVPDAEAVLARYRERIGAV
jgi:hypothetical protein